MTSARRTALRLRLIVAMVMAALLLGLGATAAWAASGAGQKPAAQPRAEHSKSKKHPGTTKRHTSKKHHKSKKKTKKKKKHKKKTTTKPTSSVGAPSTVSTPAPGPTPTAPAPVVTPARVTHLLAQQGLLVGMASSVLQDQLFLDASADNGNEAGVCESEDGAGVELTSFTVAPGGTTDLTLVLYYDASCTKPYISSTATVTSSSTGTQIGATSLYTDANGTTLGTLRTQAQTIDSNGGDYIQLAGLGTFTAAAAGSLPVSLGLTCDVTISDTATTLPCEGGVAQDFPGLGVELASLTPLNLAGNDGGSGPALTFTGTGSTLEIASSGSVSLGLNSADALTLSGTPLATLTDSSSGEAGAFDLFPPTPTGWNTSDPADGQAFQISVTDDTSRGLTGSVTASGASTPTYATFSLDQSGSGTISYSGGAPIAVTSWVLSG